MRSPVGPAGHRRTVSRLAGRHAAGAATGDTRAARRHAGLIPTRRPGVLGSRTPEPHEIPSRTCPRPTATVNPGLISLSTQSCGIAELRGLGLRAAKRVATLAAVPAGWPARAGTWRRRRASLVWDRDEREDPRPRGGGALCVWCTPESARAHGGSIRALPALPKHADRPRGRPVAAWGGPRREDHGTVFVRRKTGCTGALRRPPSAVSEVWSGVRVPQHTAGKRGKAAGGPRRRLRPGATRRRRSGRHRSRADHRGCGAVRAAP
jgi:hypothetical protein